MPHIRPKGETPLCEVKLSHEHLSVASGISPAVRLYIQIQDKSFKGTDIVSFLRHLLAHVAGKFLCYGMAVRFTGAGKSKVFA